MKNTRRLSAVFSLVVLSLLVIPGALAGSWSTVSQTLDLVEKNPVDWSIVPDGDCDGLDYTGDSKVNYRDYRYVIRNRIDANGDSVYNRADKSFIRANYQNCRAGKGVIKFKETTRRGQVVDQRVTAHVWNLNPKTKYQLIYYGFEDETSSYNDEWPHATCIGKSRRTSTKGHSYNFGGRLGHSEMLNDGVDQKFWVVLADDVDCKANEMTAWNPSEYLFEIDTV